MKKFFLIVVLICLSSVYVIGQTEKGNLMIGGSSSLSLRYSDEGNTSQTNIYFAPQLSYFIINNLSIGLQIPLHYYYYITRYDFPDRDLPSTIMELTSIEVSTFLRYYFGKHRIKPFLNANIGIGIMKMRGQNPDHSTSKSTSDIFKYEYGGGIAFFINDKVSLDLTLGYQSQTVKRDGSPNQITNKYFSRIGVSIVL